MEIIDRASVDITQMSPLSRENMNPPSTKEDWKSISGIPPGFGALSLCKSLFLTFSLHLTNTHRWENTTGSTYCAPSFLQHSPEAVLALPTLPFRVQIFWQLINKWPPSKTVWENLSLRNLFGCQRSRKMHWNKILNEPLTFLGRFSLDVPLCVL